MHTWAAKMAFMTEMYCSAASGDPCRQRMRGRERRLPLAPARPPSCALLMRHSARESAPAKTAGLSGALPVHHTYNNPPETCLFTVCHHTLQQ